MIFALLACMPDDVQETGATDTGTRKTDTETTDSGGTTGTNDGIEGKWISEGEDLSDLFAPYYDNLEANFKTDGSYVVTAHDLDGGNARYEGTYTVDTSTEPSAIVLTQSSPYAAVASGIYAVSGDVLTYEVVQTEPDYGYVPPTPASGFGSTSGPEIEPGVNVQTYRRTE